jgi:hypothetical protein
VVPQVETVVTQVVQHVMLLVLQEEIMAAAVAELLFMEEAWLVVLELVVKLF